MSTASPPVLVRSRHPGAAAHAYVPDRTEQRLHLAGGLGEGCRGFVAFQQPGHGTVVQTGAELGEQAAYGLEVRVASAASSWSKPTITVSSAVIRRLKRSRWAAA